MAASGWEPANVSGPGATVPVPGFRHPGGRCTYAELGALANASRNTVAKGLNELVRAEWVKLERTNRLDQVHFELTFPGLERGLAALDGAVERLAKEGHQGEKLMWEFLSLIIDSVNFMDQVRPGFLVNPRTGERLEPPPIGGGDYLSVATGVSVGLFQFFKGIGGSQL